jgi:hypothetical protein
MKLNINRHLFSQVNMDSGSLSMMCTVVHRFSQAGEYEGIALKGQTVLRRFTIAVVENTSSTPKAASPSQSSPSSSVQTAAKPGTTDASGPANNIATQVNIDLKDLTSNQFVLMAGGYAVFHVSAGPGGYAVQVNKLEKQGNQIKVFDNLELKDEDMLSVTVIRPGTYSVTNTMNNAKAELVVNYPELGKTRMNLSPVKIECNGQNQISPNRIRIDPSQGMIFTFKTPSRIKIELTKPDDRPSRLARRGGAATTLVLRKSEKNIVRRYRLMPSGT